jgi:hypothetical protein
LKETLISEIAMIGEMVLEFWAVGSIEIDVLYVNWIALVHFDRAFMCIP